MDIPTYIINLENAPDRLKFVTDQLDGLRIPWERIDAVFGDLLPDPIPDYDESKWERCTGKFTNKRHLGCYFSHINTCRKFLETGRPYALVLEDDAEIDPRIEALIDGALNYAEHWDLLRLSSFREGNFQVFGQLTDGFEIGYNTNILKNTAAYVINRKAARLCIEKMLPAYLPIDIALDRDWEYGFKAACAIPFPVTQRKEIESQIPRGAKIKKYRFSSKFFNFRTHLVRKKARMRYYRQLQQNT